MRYPWRQSHDFNATATVKQGWPADIVVEDDVEYDVVVARVQMMPMPVECAGPHVQFYVASVKAALFVRDNGVEEIGTRSEVTASAVNDLEALSLPRPQSLSREALSLPEANELIFVEARLHGRSQLDETGGRVIVMSGRIRFALGAILRPRLTQ